MKFEMFDNVDQFTVSQIDWERCDVDSWEGWGWHDSPTFCQSADGGKVKPIIGFNYSNGCGKLVSLLPDIIPEVGWTVIGKDSEGWWVVVPPWYVFPPKEDPPNRLKQVALVVACLLAVWGGIRMLPQATGVNQPQTTYQAK